VVLPEIKESYRSTKNTVTYNEISSKVIEGDILDRNGNLIMGNASEGTGSFAYEPEAYSYAWHPSLEEYLHGKACKLRMNMHAS
jgi:hypothetical protein